MPVRLRVLGERGGGGEGLEHYCCCSRLPARLLRRCLRLRQLRQPSSRAGQNAIPACSEDLGVGAGTSKFFGTWAPQTATDPMHLCDRVVGQFGEANLDETTVHAVGVRHSLNRSSPSWRRPKSTQNQAKFTVILTNRIK